jgi:uncharacterized protein YbjT (DUF2867 family)
MIALVAGASGLVGGQLVTILRQQKYKEIILLLRRPLGINDERVREILVDFDDLESIDEHIRADHIFISLGTTIKKAGSKEAFTKVDYSYPLNVASLFKKRGASRLAIVTALGSDEHSPFFYNKTKGAVERDILALDYDGTTILRPSLIMGDRAEHRAGEKLAMLLFQNLAFLFVGPFKKYKGVSATAIASAMVANVDQEGVHIIPSEKIQSYEK